MKLFCRLAVGCLLILASCTLLSAQGSYKSLSAEDRLVWGMMNVLNVVPASQEMFVDQHQRYAPAWDSLVASGFAPVLPEAISVEIRSEALEYGFVATVRHRDTSVFCTLFYGARANLSAEYSGQIRCHRSTPPSFESDPYREYLAPKWEWSRPAPYSKTLRIALASEMRKPQPQVGGSRIHTP